MAARIEIKELDDPVRQKQISDAVEALDGVIETKIEKGALHVSYDTAGHEELMRHHDGYAAGPGPDRRGPEAWQVFGN